MKRAFATLIVVMLLGATVATAEDAMPGLGEIMTLQQLRHIKLWFAGRAGNWPLADYEVGELGEGFDDVNKLLGGDTVDKMVGGPMKELQKAIDDKNSAAFTAAFDHLTAGCNSCHHTLDHGFIAIQRPASLPYSNQNFAPQK
jgi:cytochrome c556